MELLYYMKPLAMDDLCGIPSSIPKSWRQFSAYGRIENMYSIYYLFTVHIGPSVVENLSLNMKSIKLIVNGDHLPRTQRRKLKFLVRPFFFLFIVFEELELLLTLYLWVITLHCFLLLFALTWRPHSMFFRVC